MRLINEYTCIYYTYILWTSLMNVFGQDLILVASHLIFWPHHNPSAPVLITERSVAAGVPIARLQRNVLLSQRIST